MDTAFFLASKLFWILSRPESWLFLLLSAAAFAHWRERLRSARRLLLAGLALILAIGLLPFGEALLRPLETRFPADPATAVPRGIIVLGGGEDGRAMRASGLPEVNDAGDRFLAALALARRYPDAQLIFTGGSAAIFGARVSGAEVATASSPTPASRPSASFSKGPHVTPPKTRRRPSPLSAIRARDPGSS